ncbi:MAG: AAA family ATPase, partial [Pseudomonadota bacterium]
IDNWSRISKLSEGEKQKVSIIMAVAHDPDLLILDEPVASLDPTSRREFIEMILDRFIDEEKTVLFSTHITSDIERLAARVVLLRDGDIVLHDDLDTLKDNVCRLHLTSETDIGTFVDTIPHCLDRRIENNSATLTVSAFAHDTERRLIDSGIKVEKEQLNLEEIFLELNR